MMARGEHKTAQTAFRLPDGLLSWLRGQAGKEKPATMTDIVVRALESERDRCAGITTRVTTASVAAPVSPPPKRAPKQPAGPALPAAAPAGRAHAINCKCGICRPQKNGGQ